jgi:hypothetical protein
MRKGWFLAAVLLSTHFAIPQRSHPYTDTIPVGQVNGIVVDDQNRGVPAALVEEYSWDWKFMLASTRTDREGSFLLIPGAPVRIHYLRVSALGFDVLQVRVDQQQKAGTLRLRLRGSS